MSSSFQTITLSSSSTEMADHCPKYGTVRMSASIVCWRALAGIALIIMRRSGSPLSKLLFRHPALQEGENSTFRCSSANLVPLLSAFDPYLWLWQLVRPLILWQQGFGRIFHASPCPTFQQVCGPHTPCFSRRRQRWLVGPYPVEECTSSAVQVLVSVLHSCHVLNSKRFQGALRVRCAGRNTRSSKPR